MAKVITSSEALKQLESLPPEIVARMVKLYERLENWPQVSGAKPLTGHGQVTGVCGRAIIACSSALKASR